MALVYFVGHPTELAWLSSAGLGQATVAPGTVAIAAMSAITKTPLTSSMTLAGSMTGGHISGSLMSIQARLNKSRKVTTGMTMTRNGRRTENRLLSFRIGRARNMTITAIRMWG